MPMTAPTATTVGVKNLQSPDERRTTDHGVLEVVNLPGATIVRAVFQPGWKWSTDIKPAAGTDSCEVAHNGVVLSGRFHVRMEDGREIDLSPGDAHVVAPGHDAWVVGDEPCVILDFAATGAPASGKVSRCPCGVEFRVAGTDGVGHLVAAVQEHARGSHRHDLTTDEVLAQVEDA